MTSPLLVLAQIAEGAEQLPIPEVRRLDVFPFWRDYLGVVIAGALLTIVVAGTRKLKASSVRFVLLPSIALGVTGLSIGLLVGNSLSSVVSLAVSGLLTIYGGLIVYLLGKEVQPEQQVASTIALIFVAVGVLYGASFGSAHRHRFQLHEDLRLRSNTETTKRFEAQLRLWEYAQQKEIDVQADSVMKPK